MFSIGTTSIFESRVPCTQTTATSLNTSDITESVNGPRPLPNIEKFALLKFTATETSTPEIWPIWIQDFVLSFVELMKLSIYLNAPSPHT